MNDENRMNVNIDREQWVLIQRFVTGNAGPEERRKVERWMAESPEHRRVVQEVKNVWNHTPPEEFDVDVQHAWEQFQYRNRKEREQAPVIGYVRKEPRTSLYVIRAAALVLVTLFAGLFVYYQTYTSGQQQQEQAGAFNVLQELETAKGEKARVTFSDGTSVTLNSASSIRFPAEFQGSTREVFLDGEAYFEVAHDARKPFVVHSQDTQVEVLGTEFNVRGWSEDPGVEVVVKGGKVSVQSSVRRPDDRTEVILTEGLKTEVRRGENPVEPVNVDPVRHLLWTSGGIHFDNEPFHRVVRDLERRFNVNITVADRSLLNVPYTGTFQYAELNEILAVIGASMEVGYSREGREVEFHE